MSIHWPSNELTKLLHLDFPIIQSPMAGCSTPELVTSICYAGGLGSLGAGYMPPEEIRRAIQYIRMKTRKRFNLNLFCYQPKEKAEEALPAQLALNEYRKKMGLPVKLDVPPLQFTFDDQIEVVIEERVPVFSFSYGLPKKEYIEALKAHGTIIIGTATNVLEVQELEKQGVDAIVLQGAEAGGHRGTFLGDPADSLIGLMTFIPQARAITKLPLIASGGIVNAQGIAAALLLGAQGVQIGTAFLLSVESGAPFCYREALKKLTAHQTTITSVYSGRPARVVHHEKLDKIKHIPVAPFPYQNLIMQDLRSKCSEHGSVDFIPLYAGQGFPLISDRSALEIFYDLAQSTSLLFKELRQTPLS